MVLPTGQSTFYLWFSPTISKSRATHSSLQWSLCELQGQFKTPHRQCIKLYSQRCLPVCWVQHHQWQDSLEQCISEPRCNVRYVWFEDHSHCTCKMIESTVVISFMHGGKAQKLFQYMITQETFFQELTPSLDFVCDYFKYSICIFYFKILIACGNDR